MLGGTGMGTQPLHRCYTMFALPCCLTSPSASRNSELQCPRNDTFFFQPWVDQRVWMSVCWNTGGVLCLGKASALEREITQEQRQIT